MTVAQRGIAAYQIPEAGVRTSPRRQNPGAPQRGIAAYQIPDSKFQTETLR